MYNLRKSYENIIYKNLFSFIRMQSTIQLKLDIDNNLKNDILNKDALEFLLKLHKNFNKRRIELLNLRQIKKQNNSGKLLSYLPHTQKIRLDNKWKINSLPHDLHRRNVEITGPVDRKMIINALNSGADCFMADFEDSTSPKFLNIIQGQLNLKDAINRTIDFESNNKKYKLNEKIATLIVRPRGWHLPEKHIIYNDETFSASLVDFGLYFFHNAKRLIELGTGPYFYLPKMESHLEAQLWNDVFKFSQQALSIKQGTIKATCLIETLPAAFEMDEIIYELKEHSAGLNAGRWDYIFSCIKTYQNNQDFILADRSLITMEVAFMRAYALQLIKTCHKRNAPAIGGMSALIPIKNDEEANKKALEGVRLDKERDAKDGFDGGWVAHPGLVELAKKEFLKVLGNKPNQIDKQREDVNFDNKALLNFQPKTPITENGLRTNISVGIQYLGAWLAGNGCVPINNLMEDAATAEISRSQVWNWIKSKNGLLNDGRKITKELVKQIINEELNKIELKNKNKLPMKKAACIFEKLSLDDELEDFLTLPLYKEF